MTTNHDDSLAIELAELQCGAEEEAWLYLSESEKEMWRKVASHVAQKLAAAPDVDALAQEIRRVDGAHALGAAALAEALLPFLRGDQATKQTSGDELRAWRERFPNHEYRPQDECISLKLQSQ